MVTVTIDSAVTTARTVLQLLQEEEFAEVCELFAPTLRGQVWADALRGPWQDLIAAHGPVVFTDLPATESPSANATVVKIAVRCERGAFAVVMAIGGGTLSGLQFAPPEAADPVPAWQPPPYADPALFTDDDVVVGDGALATPGTLSLPTAAGPLPAVVLLAGSGPNDRDATMGANKVFKDLAWGLASRGVVVLRFEKITYTHREALADVPDLTAVDEYVRPGVAAVRLLREHPAVDAARVFVLGHSQGGTMAPRVAAAEPAVAGLVVLAGATAPVHHTLVRQFRYLATLRNPGADVTQDPSVQTVIAQAQLLDGPDLAPTTPAHLLPFGVPAPYWLDLRGYDPVAVAAQLRKPMLIGQGGRDYQVTVADDLVGWQTGLAGLPGVTIRVYDADDHLLFSGSGPSTPADYQPAQHVDAAVVADVADWLVSR